MLVHSNRGAYGDGALDVIGSVLSIFGQKQAPVAPPPPDNTAMYLGLGLGALLVLGGIGLVLAKKTPPPVAA